MPYLSKLLKKNVNIYSLRAKKNLYTYLKKLTKHHFYKCKEYKNILNSEKINIDKFKNLEQIPYLPADLFKWYSIKSISNNKIYKTLNSSGTSSQIRSKIYLDKETSNLQSKVLMKIVNSITKSDRIPMIIIDTPKIFKDNLSYSARVAGVLGFSIFSTEKLFLFDNNMNINYKDLNLFLKKFKNQKILLFGFTYIIWKYFYKNFRKLKNIDLSNGILIHGGGWKKLNNEKISNKEFKDKLKKKFKIKNIYNYYGMVEQTGSIFFECKKSFFHPSIFNDVIIRDKISLKPKSIGENGVVQSLSILPLSYPGHSILTEDEGIIIGLDGCKCGIRGKYFKILGRIEKAEIRGCSDTYE